MEIETEWLSVWAPNYCTFGECLNEPPPFYDTNQDQVLCYTTAAFGVVGWTLPSALRPHGLDLQHYRIFATAFLAGDVFDKLSAYREKLLASPSVMLKPWAKLQQRTDILLSAIVSKDIRTRGTLKTIWKVDKMFLYNEYCEWLPQSLHSEVQLMWPPV